MKKCDKDHNGLAALILLKNCQYAKRKCLLQEEHFYKELMF